MRETWAEMIEGCYQVLSLDLNHVLELSSSVNIDIQELELIIVLQFSDPAPILGSAPMEIRYDTAIRKKM